MRETRELNPVSPSWRHWAWYWLHPAFWQLSVMGTRETEPCAHLLEGIELGIEYIWIPGSSLGGELNPGLTFLKALNLVLNARGFLAAVWKGNQGNWTLDSPSWRHWAWYWTHLGPWQQFERGIEGCGLSWTHHLFQLKRGNFFFLSLNVLLFLMK